MPEAASWVSLLEFVKKPLDGAKKDGAGGFLKGVGQGTMGLVAKPGSGNPPLLDGKSCDASTIADLS